MFPASPFERLCEGNARFVSGESMQRDHVSRRLELVSVQHPYAAVLTCADSRVSPEILFDAGLGDLFVVRNAGNVVDVNVLASLEYAVHHLGVDLVAVLGHYGCGAVNAACSPAAQVGNLASLVEELGESVRRGGGDPAGAVVENVMLARERIRVGSELLRGEMDGGRLTVKGGVYSLDEGRVVWLV